MRGDFLKKDYYRKISIEEVIGFLVSILFLYIYTNLLFGIANFL